MVTYFRYFLPLEKEVVSHLNKLEMLSSKIRFFAKFGWNRPSSSGEEDFSILSMNFLYFVIISLEKGHGPAFEQTWISFTQGCFVPSLVEIGRAVLEEKNFKFRQCIFVISWLSSLGKGCGPLFEQLDQKMLCAKYGWNWPMRGFFQFHHCIFIVS